MKNYLCYFDCDKTNIDIENTLKNVFLDDEIDEFDQFADVAKKLPMWDQRLFTIKPAYTEYWGDWGAWGILKYDEVIEYIDECANAEDLESDERDEYVDDMWNQVEELYDIDSFLSEFWDWALTRFNDWNKN